MTSIINVPNKQIQEEIVNSNNFTEEQTAEDLRQTELLCKLDDINNNLKILVTYFALITNQSISKDDTE